LLPASRCRFRRLGSRSRRPRRRARSRAVRPVDGTVCGRGAVALVRQCRGFDPVFVPRGPELVQCADEARMQMKVSIPPRSGEGWRPRSTAATTIRCRVLESSAAVEDELHRGLTLPPGFVPPMPWTRRAW
jgi:hypothetical protein